MSPRAPFCLLLSLIPWSATVSAQDSVTLVSASGYGNFHAGGVVVTVAGDVNRNAAVALEWREAGASFQPGHPLSRIDATHFAGSLFWLQPGTTYEARVTLADPDGVSGAASAVTTVATRVDSLPEPSLRRLYVSPTGKDLNAGTDPGTPLRTIQRAADVAQAGDLVLVQPGVFRESVTVRRSGTAAQPIVFRGASGAILDGADAAIAAGVPWTLDGNGVYSYAAGFATGHVVTDAGRLYRYPSLADLSALGAGAPGGVFFDGTRLHVKFADGSAPSGHAIHVARLEDGFLIDGRSFVRIENFEIRHFGAGSFGKGVYLRYSSDCTVRASRIHEVGRAGVWIKGGDRHTIEDNEIWDTSISGWPWSLSKGSSAETDGVVFSNDVGRGHVVRRNTIHGTFNGMGPCGSTPPPAGVTNETDVYENVLYDHTDDGFEPEGYCSNVRIWGNTIRDVHMAVAAAPAAPGPLYVVSNVAFRFGNTRTSQQDGYTASALKINSGYPTPIGPLFLYHNTFLTDAPATDALALMNPGTGTFIVARNNVMAATRYAVYKVNPIPWDGNGNDLHTTDASRLVSWQGVRYDTLARYRAIGQEAQGISAPPDLVDPIGGHFEPQPGSPLVDRGILLPGINDGFLGTAPDIGAVESEVPLPTLSIGHVRVTEGQAGFTLAQFVVSLSEGSDQTVTLSYATADGTARAGSDYVAASGTVSFSPGSLEHTIEVTVNADVAVEPDEIFFVNLANASGALLLDGQGEGTIVNDDVVPPPSEAVVWTRAVGVAVTGNSLRKTAATRWGNAGASSTKALVSGDGYVEFQASETNTHRILGLSNGDTNQSRGDIDFGLQLRSDGRVHVYEKGSYRGSFGYASGDLLRVALESGVVKYRRNGALVYTSSAAPVSPLLVDTALYTNGATLTSVVIGGRWE